MDMEKFKIIKKIKDVANEMQKPKPKECLEDIEKLIQLSLLRDAIPSKFRKQASEKSDMHTQIMAITKVIDLIVEISVSSTPAEQERLQDIIRELFTVIGNVMNCSIVYEMD